MRNSASMRALFGFTAVVTLIAASSCSSSSLQPLPLTDASIETGSGGADTSSGGASSLETGGTAQGGDPGTGGAPPVTCLPSEKKCSGVCVDPMSNASNCGDCGIACPATQTCTNGQCGCSTENPDLCGLRCVNLKSTVTDCGECYKACGLKRCIDGQCNCRETDLICNGACIDPMTDRLHCGDCETKCVTNYDCAEGKCVLSCANYGLADCGTGACTDTTKDVNNCGGCGTVCPNQAAITCKNSQCVCGNPIATRCGDLCVDVSSDTRYCGNCDTACKPGEICSSGICACASTSIKCGGVCYDPTTDSNHCGDCNTACGANLHCAGGTCVCNTGFTSCDGTCMNTQTDPAHCGTCENACGTGQSCTAGKCECDTGMSKCGSECVNEQTDSKHCGDCDTTCSSSQSCIDGKCACEDGLTACGQACVDAQNDALNCGGCAKTCSGKQMCQGGTCKTSVVRVQSFSTTTTDAQQLQMSISVCNASGSSLSLTGMTIKYWYTTGGASGNQTVESDYDPVTPKPTIAATLLELSAFRDKADAVLSITFGATTLAAGACTGGIQLRIHQTDLTCGGCKYGAPTTDYSYVAGTALADNQYITAYSAAGLLIWGLEPAPAPQ